MITAATSKYVLAPSTATRATKDQIHAASVPIEIKVSIVAVRWRRLSTAARWKPEPAQKTTGVESAAASHSQPANWSGGIMASAASGAVRTAAATRRTASVRARPSSSCTSAALRAR